MLFNICNQSDFNRQQCLKDWDVWLIPELQKGWDLYTGEKTPYQEEKEKLDENNSKN
jgi:hypothetical protein